MSELMRVGRVRCSSSHVHTSGRQLNRIDESAAVAVLAVITMLVERWNSTCRLSHWKCSMEVAFRE